LSDPHSRSKQAGVQGLSMHWFREQILPGGQPPQDPLQPSDPHSRPVQSGVQTQIPCRHSHW